MVKTMKQKQTSSSGQVPDGDVRLTANIGEEYHLRLKIAAARRKTTVGELIEQMIDYCLKREF